MVDISLTSSSLESSRVLPLYEWTFAIFIANVTIQVYRLVVQLSTIVFDSFRLSYAVNLFWPLTTDDLKPYYHYFRSQYELLSKFAENLVLTGTAIYGCICLLDFSIVGLGINFLIFFCHSLCIIVGTLISPDANLKIATLEFVIWTFGLTLEVLTSLLSLVVILDFRLLTG